MTTFTFDGTTFDLTRVWIDVYGGHWEWTGLSNETGQPLMQRSDDTPLSLPDVYYTYGPLIPAPISPTVEAVRAVLLDAPITAREPSVADAADVFVSPGAWASAWRRCRTVLHMPAGGVR